MRRCNLPYVGGLPWVAARLRCELCGAPVRLALRLAWRCRTCVVSVREALRLALRDGIAARRLGPRDGLATFRLAWRCGAESEAGELGGRLAFWPRGRLFGIEGRAVVNPTRIAFRGRFRWAPSARFCHLRRKMWRDYLIFSCYTNVNYPLDCVFAKMRCKTAEKQSKSFPKLKAMGS